MLVDNEDLWQLYDKNQNDDNRKTLMEAYLPLVHWVVGRMDVGLPGYIDKEDLVGYGVIGLSEAIKRFDRQRGFKFETYAVQRIRGSVLDAVRQQGWAPRSVIEKIRGLNQAVGRLEALFGSEYSDHQLAEELGINIEELHQLLMQYHQLSVMSLEESLGTYREGEAFRLGDMLVDNGSPDPVQVYEDKEFQSTLARAIENLVERERQILALYYYEGLTLKEIGRVLDVSESRVSQLHARVLARLRLQLGGMGV
ncbi:MAG: FliA/WhiG family RNA polymerase sigma factor [Bacillota bacterium]